MKQKNFISDTAAAYLIAAPVTWKAMVRDHLSGVPWKEWAQPAAQRESITAVIRELDSIMKQAARLRAYLQVADNYPVKFQDQHGEADLVHDAAVQSCNKLANKIRKALGYSYRDDVRF